MAFERLAKFLGKKREEHPMRDNKNRVRPVRFDEQDAQADKNLTLTREGNRDTVHVEDRRAAYDAMLRKGDYDHDTNSRIAMQHKGNRNWNPKKDADVRKANESAKEALRRRKHRSDAEKLR